MSTEPTHNDAVCAEDGEPAVVGVGQPPVWLCLRHYDERMAAIGATVRRLREAIASAD